MDNELGRSKQSHILLFINSNRRLVTLASKDLFNSTVNKKEKKKKKKEKKKEEKKRLSVFFRCQ